MYEHRQEALLTRPAFMRRVAVHALTAISLLAAGVGLGMIGFRLTEHYSWVDAFLNACMLLGGMGQVNPIVTTGGKVFAGAFALLAGFGFIAVATLVMVPIAHRLLHALHLESDGSVPGA